MPDHAGADRSVPEQGTNRNKPEAYGYDPVCSGRSAGARALRGFPQPRSPDDQAALISERPSQTIRRPSTKLRPTYSPK